MAVHFAQAVWPTAAPRVIAVRCISHARALESASSVYPLPMVNVARNEARAAVLSASVRSSPRRHSAWASADSAPASAAAR